MRKLEKVFVEYVGYRQPETMDELELEILGLRTAVAAAKSRIASLKQSRKLYLAGEKNAKTVKKGQDNNQNIKESTTGLDKTGSKNEGQDKV